MIENRSVAAERTERLNGRRRKLQVWIMFNISIVVTLLWDKLLALGARTFSRRTRARRLWNIKPRKEWKPFKLLCKVLVNLSLMSCWCM